MGIFHDKFGVMEDEAGDIICFRGSNNETAAAFNSNYEAFDITCSWQSSDFDFSKITKSKETFHRLWNNMEANVLVCDMDDTIHQQLLSYNKGKVIVDKVQLEPNCFLLDYDTELKLEMKTSPDIILNNKMYKLRLKRYVDTNWSNNMVLKFNQQNTYTSFKKN